MAIEYVRAYPTNVKKAVIAYNADGSLSVTGGMSADSLTLTNPLAIAQGGTGQTTAQAAIDALVPSQTGKSGYVLASNGTNAYWAVMGVAGLINYLVMSSGITDGTSNWISVISFKFYKNASVNNLKITFMGLNVDTGSSTNAQGRIYIGGVAGGTATRATPYGTIDISSLTANTEYDACIQLRNAYGSGENTVMTGFSAYNY